MQPSRDQDNGREESFESLIRRAKTSSEERSKQLDARGRLFGFLHKVSDLSADVLRPRMDLKKALRHGHEFDSHAVAPLRN